MVEFRNKSNSINWILVTFPGGKKYHAHGRFQGSI